MREIDVLDLLPDIVQHRAPLERDRAQMRRQQRKIVRRQRRQESVEASVLELPGKRERAIRHQRRSPYRADARSGADKRKLIMSATPRLDGRGRRGERICHLQNSGGITFRWDKPRVGDELAGTRSYTFVRRAKG